MNRSLYASIRLKNKSWNKYNLPKIAYQIVGINVIVMKELEKH